MHVSDGSTSPSGILGSELPSNAGSGHSPWRIFVTGQHGAEHHLRDRGHRQDRSTAGGDGLTAACADSSLTALPLAVPCLAGCGGQEQCRLEGRPAARGRVPRGPGPRAPARQRLPRRPGPPGGHAAAAPRGRPTSARTLPAGLVRDVRCTTSTSPPPGDPARGRGAAACAGRPSRARPRPPTTTCAASRDRPASPPARSRGWPTCVTPRSPPTRSTRSTRSPSARKRVLSMARQTITIIFAAAAGRSPRRSRSSLCPAPGRRARTTRTPTPRPPRRSRRV